MMQNILTKTMYCRGIGCPKMLWLDQYAPEHAAEAGDLLRAREGIEVGKLARTYFDDTVQIHRTTDLEQMVDQTQEAMESGADVIAEASFMTDGCFCSVDLLRRCNDGWDIIEAKSSVSVKPQHIDDAAFQRYVLERAGLKIAGVYLMHVDGGYVRGEELDVHQLLVMEDITEDTSDKMGEIPSNIGQLADVLAWEEEPKAVFGLQCGDSSGACPYQQHCFRDFPMPSVMDVRGMSYKKKYEAVSRGIISYQDILDSGFSIGDKAGRQIRAELENLPAHIDSAGIKECLRAFHYPMYYLDFETYNPAIPPFPGTCPYMQIPFQYSLHVKAADSGGLEHYEYLGDGVHDPRRELAEQLCRDIPRDVCVIAYNMGFEKGVLRNLAAVYPDLSGHLMSIHDNLQDLMIPFQKQHYYCRELRGSYSIKYVLPALCPDDPELDYQQLAGVHNGTEASGAYFTMGVMKNAEEIANVRRNLLAYCRLDTLAMVKVHEQLGVVVSAEK